MPPVAVILPVVLQLLQMAPGLIRTGKTAIDTAREIWDEVTSENAPTAEEAAQYEAAYQASEAAFQASARRVDPV